MGLVTRVMKARKRGWCVLCGGPVQVSQQIGLIPGRGWAHTSCIVAGRKRQEEAV